MHASQTAGATVALVVILLIAVCVYFLPTIVGSACKVVNIGSVFAVNLLPGWTLIGWAVALAMAPRTNPPHAYPQFWQGPPRRSRLQVLVRRRAGIKIRPADPISSGGTAPNGLITARHLRRDRNTV